MWATLAPLTQWLANAKGPYLATSSPRSRGTANSSEDTLTFTLPQELPQESFTRHVDSLGGARSTPVKVQVPVDPMNLWVHTSDSKPKLTDLDSCFVD